MIPFLNLHKINNRFKKEFEQTFTSFLDSGHYILGQSVLQFEKEFAAYCGTQYSVGVASGLDALILIFRGYKELGVLQDNDEVLVPSNTYIATILSILEAGLTPVLVAPLLETYNINTEAIAQKITPKTKAILVVHLYGQLANMEAIKAIAKQYHLLVIEDAAQAHGAIDINNHKAGNLSNAAAFSFYPSKNLGALGDGGVVTTSNEDLSRIIRQIRNYGASSKYVNEVRGVNSRLDAIQARFLSIKLPFLDIDNESRRNIAKQYISEINNNKVTLPFYDNSNNHVFHLFVVRVADREHFIQYLEDKGVQTLIHYPIPPHQQKALKGIFKGACPIAEKIHQEVVSLPISPLQNKADTQKIINIINQY